MRCSHATNPPPFHSNLSIDARARSNVAEVTSSATSREPQRRQAKAWMVATCRRYSSAKAAGSRAARAAKARSSSPSTRELLADGSAAVHDRTAVPQDLSAAVDRLDPVLLLPRRHVVVVAG